MVDQTLRFVYSCRQPRIKLVDAQCSDRTEWGRTGARIAGAGAEAASEHGLEMGGQTWTGQDGQTEGDRGYKLGRCVAVIV